MIKQYPHTATVIITGDTGTDSKGYPLPPSQRTVTLICRAEPNARNAIIYTGDGRAYNFSYTVYIKAGQEEIPVNSRLTLISDSASGQVLFTDDGSVLMTDNNDSIASGLVNSVQKNGIVKMYSKGQFNARLWL